MEAVQPVRLAVEVRAVVAQEPLPATIHPQVLQIQVAAAAEPAAGTLLRVAQEAPA